MSHQTFKVSIVINATVENFYIKHYVDDFQPIFQKFKQLVFQRNPTVNVANLKIYWIDAENDQILISCEEDFRLFIEQGAGKKIFFSVKNAQSVQVEDEEVAMDAEESGDRSKAERKSRKSVARDEEKQKRAAKRLAEKMRNAEEKLRSEEERRSKHPEKYERKSAERLERAQRRCDQIRQIMGAFDPANLNPTSVNVGASTSTAEQTSIDESLALLHPSAETIRLLSNAIAGCLQPCNLINKILNEIIGMVPQPAAESPSQSSSDQQQQTEVPLTNTATNTSDINTPVVPAHPSSQEIEALFKEAAKELEKMNEIVNSGKSLESSSSLASSMTGTTQIERIFSNITDSAISNATIVNNEAPEYVDEPDTKVQSPSHDFNIVSPPKSMRSRESSIEVHDVNSMMSDDSRDWTMLDAVDHEDESMIQDSMLSEAQTAAAKLIAEEKKESIKSVETQTPTSLLSSAGSSGMSQEQVQASIKMSIENVGKMNDIVKNSIASAQQSLSSIQTPVEVPVVVREVPVVVPAEVPIVATAPVQAAPKVTAVRLEEPSASILTFPPIAALRQQPVVVNPPQVPTLHLPSASTAANLMANRLSAGNQAPKWKPSAVGPAVIVYDPNPKINAAVHQMVNMGFTNEGGWLTQLLINVDGDVPKAINFLTPQPKNKKV